MSSAFHLSLSKKEQQRSSSASSSSEESSASTEVGQKRPNPNPNPRRKWNPQKISETEISRFDELVRTHCPRRRTSATDAWEILTELNPGLDPEKLVKGGVVQMLNNLNGGTPGEYFEDILPGVRIPPQLREEARQLLARIATSSHTKHVFKDVPEEMFDLRTLSIELQPFVFAIAVTGNRVADVARAQVIVLEKDKVMVDWGVRKATPSRGDACPTQEYAVSDIAARGKLQHELKKLPLRYTKKKADAFNPIVPADLQDIQTIATRVNNAIKHLSATHFTSSCYRDHLDRVLQQQVSEKKISELEYSFKTNHKYRTGLAHYTASKLQ